MRYQTLRGFNDILPDDFRYWRHILAAAQSLADRFGYVQVDPPLLEETRLFLRGLQEGSAVILDKEMYSFESHDGANISLRPEFTAGVMRLFVEHGLYTWPKPVKLFAIGPLFRHEKPQAGRFRQHVQFNAELLGEEDAAADLEVMQLAYSLYAELGFRGLAFQLNSIGCSACRPAYIATLVAYLRQFEAQLPAVDQRRLAVNPLRVLDSKEEATQALLVDGAAHRRSPVRGLRRPFRRSHRLSRRPLPALHGQPPPGARLRLLCAHRVRGVGRGIGRPERAVRRRQI